jgi:hypothetical protein
MSFEEFKRQAIAGYAYGGIAGLDGRRRYGIGSKIKKRIRKLIPNEAAKVAEVAAPFVAPFNPLLAAGMSGIGGFDRHGSIGKGLKSGLMNYAGGQLARGIGGGMENLQTGINPFQSANLPGSGTGTFSRFFSNPIQSTGGVGGFLNERKAAQLANKREAYGAVDQYKTAKQIADTKKASSGNALHKFLKGMGMDTAAMAGIVGASALAGLYTKANPADDSIEQMRGEGLDIESIRTEVQEAFKDPTGKALEEIRIKYPFLGAKETKNLDLMAQGGRAGYYAGGQSIPSEYTIEDARKTAMQDRLGGITEVMKQADLYRQGDVGQMYAAQGGRIGYDMGGDVEDKFMELVAELREAGFSQQEAIDEAKKRLGMAQGGRAGFAEGGGIMDLGGMEKDYRETGGFVDLGAEEKADDVPARLSVNEFVMTADAVRGAGDGDIDKGAERMEDLMEKLEAKNKRQQGASDMFEVSERLSAVV